jgi:hypothetical protein
VKVETTLQTIDWMNQQLDKIMCRTDFLDEMIQEEEDENILMFLEKKLEGLDKQCSDMGHKIDFELKQLSYLEEVK